LADSAGNFQNPYESITFAPQRPMMAPRSSGLYQRSGGKIRPAVMDFLV